MTTRDANPAQATEAATPWWRIGTVWLVVGGPATVVVAALVTAAIAIAGADTLVSDPPAAASQSKSVTQGVHADTPALQGRNHAASPLPR
jgi:hypothetical protein